MKLSKSFFAVAVASMAFSSCSNDGPDMTVQDDNVVRINAMHPSMNSRVHDTGFDKGDQIGVYIVDTSASLQPGGNMVNNGCFAFDGSSWASTRQYYWNKGTYNVYAYYPYTAKIEDTENYLFVLPSDQSTQEGFSAADFLWASATDQTAGTQAVNLKFSHALSNLIVNLAKSEDYDGELPTDFEVYVHGTYTTAKIDLANGGAIADTSTGLGSIKAKKLSNTQYSAIVVPQRIDSRRALVEVVTGNVSYLMEGTMSFKPGYRHTITVTLSKSPQQVEIEIGGGIGTWN